MQHPKLKPFNFKKWCEDNASQLIPPVGNKLLHTEGNMIVMVVGGPNTRVDFHDDPVEEWFFQQKGDMMLKIADGGKIYDVPVREGEVFLLPPHVRHAPQRPQEGSPAWHERRVRVVLLQLRRLGSPGRSRVGRPPWYRHRAAQDLRGLSQQHRGSHMPGLWHRASGQGKAT